jgi:hypothetical protein
MRRRQRRSARPTAASLRSLKSAARRLARKRGGDTDPVPVVTLEGEPDLPLEPLTPAFLVKNLGDLRVPTVALPAEVVTVDGRVATGRIFVPAAANRHAGAMRAEEWMNESADFFPFLPDASDGPELLNRHEILVLTVPAHADAGDVLEGTRLPERAVVVDCRGRKISGTLVIDMPEEHSRVLDYLNRPGRVLTLRDGLKHHLIQKDRITRVKETRKE